MLERLTIKNYALIDSVDLEFSSGLTIVTGETGSGKSIILGALSLLTGERADTRVVTNPDKKSVVEGVFGSPEPGLEMFFNMNEVEWNPEEIIIRREISGNGRSRAFVNDQPVNLNVLAILANHLLDIHSQHQNVLLVDPKAQLEIIDSFADNSELRAEYSLEFSRFVNIRNRIRNIREEIEKARENREYLKMQLEGLKVLNPKKGELKEIEHRFDILSRADEMRDDLQSLCALLGRNDEGVIDQLYESQGIGERLEFLNITERLETAIIEIKDIYETALDELSSIEADPQVAEKLSKRMRDYYVAVKHYRVQNADQLEDLMVQIEQQLDAIEGGGGELPLLEKEGKEIAGRLKVLGEALTVSRTRGGENFSEMVLSLARPLGLHNLKFQVSVHVGKLGPTGQDKIEFLTSFNKNQSPSPIAGQASGGEMARLMLSIKAGMAERMQLPTIIFDEVDTGVSGEIADKMGRMMSRISDRIQILTITHLPQVAARGDQHLKVYKFDEGERTLTRVRELNKEERIREIAAMMSGSEVGEAALHNAAQLLKTD